MKSYYKSNNFKCEIIKIKYHRYFIFNAHENGCPCNNWACVIAAFNNHIDCLEYLYKNGYTCYGLLNCIYG